MSKNLFTALLLMLSLSACSSSATMVRRDGLGGRVALSGAYMPAMADARMLMVEHCRGRFRAVERGDHLEFRCQKPAGREELLVARAGQAASE